MYGSYLLRFAQPKCTHEVGVVSAVFKNTSGLLQNDLMKFSNWLKVRYIKDSVISRHYSFGVIQRI